MIFVDAQSLSELLITVEVESGESIGRLILLVAIFKLILLALSGIAIQNGRVVSRH